MPETTNPFEDRFNKLSEGQASIAIGLGALIHVLPRDQRDEARALLREIRERRAHEPIAVLMLTLMIGPPTQS